MRADVTATRTTALYHVHRKLGANLGDLQGWAVPKFYRDSKEELNLVLHSAGICDLSHYGKVDVKGNGIDRFLETNFTSVAVARKPGEVRISSQEGRKDSVSLIYACRLTKEHALLLTDPIHGSHSVLDFGEGAFRYRDGVSLTNLTSTLVTFNISGPSSSGVLRKLVQVELSGTRPGESFCFEAGLAKIHSILVRRDIGDVPSFDVYCGRDYAEYAWEALMEAGHEFGMAAFGLDAYDALRKMSARGGRVK